MYWDKKEHAERARSLIAKEGITVRNPLTGNAEPCMDFRVEDRPEGGFSISSEVPIP